MAQPLPPPSTASTGLERAWPATRRRPARGIAPPSYAPSHRSPSRTRSPRSSWPDVDAGGASAKVAGHGSTCPAASGSITGTTGAGICSRGGLARCWWANDLWRRSKPLGSGDRRRKLGAGGGGGVGIHDGGAGCAAGSRTGRSRQGLAAPDRRGERSIVLNEDVTPYNLLFRPPSYWRAFFLPSPCSGLSTPAGCGNFCP